MVNHSSPRAFTCIEKKVLSICEDHINNLQSVESILEDSQNISSGGVMVEISFALKQLYKLHADIVDVIDDARYSGEG